MTPERWQQIKQFFNSALEREQSERSAFLAEACGDDESLRSEVESLLSSHERDGRFIDAPAVEFVADLLIDNQSTMTSGQTLGSYRILSTLGRGGMGEVYLAEDTRLRRKIRIEKHASLSTVVWNPWIAKSQQMPDFGNEEYERMICVESGNVSSNQIRLPPGEVSRLTVRLSSSAL